MARIGGGGGAAATGPAAAAAAAAAMDVRQLSASNNLASLYASQSLGLGSSHQQQQQQEQRNSDPTTTASDSVTDVEDISISNPFASSHLASDIASSFLDSSSLQGLGPAHDFASAALGPPGPGGGLPPPPADEWSGTTAVSSTSHQGLGGGGGGGGGGITSQAGGSMGPAAPASAGHLRGAGPAGFIKQQQQQQEPYVFDSHPTATNSQQLGGLEILQSKPVGAVEQQHKTAAGSAGPAPLTHQQQQQQQLRRMVANSPGGLQLQQPPPPKQQLQQGTAGSASGTTTSSQASGFLSNPAAAAAATGSGSTGQPDFCFQESTSFQGTLSSSAPHQQQQHMELDASDYTSDQQLTDFEQQQQQQLVSTSHQGGGSSSAAASHHQLLLNNNGTQQQQHLSVVDQPHMSSRNHQQQLVSNYGSRSAHGAQHMMGFQAQQQQQQAHSPRLLGLMHAAAAQQQQQAGFGGAGQSNFSSSNPQSHYFSSNSSSSPHHLMQAQAAAAAVGASSPSYQAAAAAAAKRHPTLSSQMQAVQAQALSQAHARAQAANQQAAAATQQAMYHMAAAAAGAQQQQQHQQQQQQQQQSIYSMAQQQQQQQHNFLYHGNHGQHHPPGTNSVIKLPGGVHHMLANMRPSYQNQLLQGLKARQLLQSSAASALAGYAGAAAAAAPLTMDGLGIAAAQTPMPVPMASQCLQVLRHYIQEQRKRPQDNNIGFWRTLVHDFFAPGGKKRWCLTSYNSSPVGKHAQGLFPMEYWFCNLCGIHPGRGFESCTDVLPRLFKIKYDSGLVDELLFLDVAEEYVLSSGRLVLEYPRAVHESIFPELRVVRYGRLRVTFTQALKICSWEFCTKAHEEVVPRKNLLDQAHQLASSVIEADQEGFDTSIENLKSHCNEFTQTARQLAVKLDAPTVNDLGFSKRYVRCLQISEVVNSMKDLISFEHKTKLGAVEALARFPNARKLQMNGLLSDAQGSLTQIIDQLTQGPSANAQATQTSGLSRVPSQSLQHLQGHLLNQLQGSSLSQLRDLSSLKLSQQFAQLQPQVRSQMEARNLNLSQHQSGVHQMQPPALPHLQQSLGHSQTLSGGQATSQFSAQTISQMQAQPSISQLQAQSLNQMQTLSQAQAQAQSLSQSQALSQLSSQSLSQSPNYTQLGHQPFQQTLAKQIVPQSSGQAVSQSAHSLNQNAGQQSLPGTPQSEMSDMRTAA